MLREAAAVILPPPRRCANSSGRPAARFVAALEYNAAPDWLPAAGDLCMAFALKLFSLWFCLPTPRFLRGWRVPVVLVALAVSAALVAPADGQGASRLLRLATTTSTDNSGLLAHILPRFERARGYAVQVISVGTGKALRLGENGDVDVILVHDPRSERRFIARGHGVERRAVMANDFIIAGPRADPGRLREAASTADAFRRLHESGGGGALFVSRGDDSGTHKKELDLWRAAGVDARRAWRREVGQGMGRALQIADELQAYILIDRATWTFLKHNTSLALLFEGGEALRNHYGVMAVNPARHATNIDGARALIDWLTSAAGQAAIGAYTVHGTQLFMPTATVSPASESQSATDAATPSQTATDASTPSQASQSATETAPQ